MKNKWPMTYIEQENKRLREALEKIACETGGWGFDAESAKMAYATARRALEGEEQPVMNHLDMHFKTTGETVHIKWPTPKQEEDSTGHFPKGEIKRLQECGVPMNRENGNLAVNCKEYKPCPFHGNPKQECTCHCHQDCPGSRDGRVTGDATARCLCYPRDCTHCYNSHRKGG